MVGKGGLRISQCPGHMPLESQSRLHSQDAAQGIPVFCALENHKSWEGGLRCAAFSQVPMGLLEVHVS